MKRIFTKVLFLSLSCFAGTAQTADQYQNLLQNIAKRTLTENLDQTFLVRALSDENLKMFDRYYAYSLVDQTKLSVADTLHYFQVEQELFPHKKGGKKNYKDLLKKIKKQGLDRATAIMIASDKNVLDGLYKKLRKKYRKQIDSIMAEIKWANTQSEWTPEKVQDLFYNTPDLADYENGQYKDGLRLFLFCRNSREFPCLFVMKDIFNTPVFDDSKDRLWSLPALAKSSRNLPYNVRNGYTPQGVHTMNSVMPEANAPLSFGKFRRVIMNWVPGVDNQNTKLFLNESLHSMQWWRQASISRDVGRDLLRIHGTGKINQNSRSTYFPHVPTAGCISTREGKYGEVEFVDQRVILDQMMRAMQLAPIYSNETAISGALYVVELDDRKAAVTLNDLKRYGIKIRR